MFHFFAHDVRLPEVQPMWSTTTTTAAGREFSVVWRWRTDRYRDEFSEVRRKVYKTQAGARLLLAKLLSNDGKYEKATETEPTRYDDGLTIEHWQIDFARIESRAVFAWEPEQ